jgi:acetyl esterase/lipase
MQVGEAEILLDDSMRVAERAKQAGVQVDLEVWDEMARVACLREALAGSAAGN